MIKRKLLYSINTKMPSRFANGVHVAKMCEALADEFDVTLQLPKYRDSYEKDIFAYYGIQRNFTVQFLSVPAEKGILYWFSMATLWQVLTRHFDVIYTRTLEVAFLLSLFRKKVIFEAHAPYTGRGPLKQWLMGQCLKNPRVLRIVVISQALKDLVCDLYKPEDFKKLLVLHDGASIAGRPPASLKTNVFKAGYFGSLFPGRGIDLIVECAKKLPTMSFHVFGGTNEQIESLKKMAPANLQVEGYLEPALVPEKMTEMDVLLAPYQEKLVTAGGENTSSWMSPLKIFEYMSAGRPILCSDLPVIREILNEQNAILCRPTDLNQWCGALVSIAENPEQATRLADQAYLDFTKNLTWQARSRSIRDLYPQPGNS